jgi:hypothetical protein
MEAVENCYAAEESNRHPVAEGQLMMTKYELWL